MLKTDVAKVHNIRDACSILMEKVAIDYGQYDKLKVIFETIEHRRCKQIVEECEKKIRDMKDKCFLQTGII